MINTFFNITVTIKKKKKLVFILYVLDSYIN